ncbi:hypothetical protein QC763_0020560 [Podospora pseudopauciseta]|uniref:Uncharacterized protein n=1 Tax=Podospora pseudopauciseta TaxID=2093780 RepID=A0ABR0I126_9PEZI|nr:hypothetical protein QC763_0020560 [Podospora pseudopauciseta]
MGKSVFWGFLHATSWIWGKRRQAKAGNLGHFLMANGGLRLIASNGVYRNAVGFLPRPRPSGPERDQDGQT